MRKSGGCDENIDVCFSWSMGIVDSPSGHYWAGGIYAGAFCDEILVGGKE